MTTHLFVVDESTNKSQRLTKTSPIILLLSSSKSGGSSSLSDPCVYVYVYVCERMCVGNKIK